MYFDPDWIFSKKPDKHDYPNITGLMDDKPKPPKKQKAEVISSMADVFARPEPIPAIKPLPAQQIPVEDNTPDRLRRIPRSVQNAGNVYPNGWMDEYRQLTAEKSGKYNALMSPGDLQNSIRITDNKYNIRNNLMVDRAMLNEIQRVAQAGKLSPEQTLLIAALSSNEDEFGQTRNLFGINDLYMDYGDPSNLKPDSYEANQYRKFYSGDLYSDLAGYIKRKTNNFQNIEGWNSRFAQDKKINPRGETYTDRIMRHVDILLNNPEFLKALFNGQVPQFNFTQQN